MQEADAFAGPELTREIRAGQKTPSCYPGDKNSTSFTQQLSPVEPLGREKGRLRDTDVGHGKRHCP